MDYPIPYRQPAPIPHQRQIQQLVPGGSGIPHRNYVSAGDMSYHPADWGRTDQGSQIASRLHGMYRTKLAHENRIEAAENKAMNSGIGADYEMDSESALRDELHRLMAQHDQQTTIPQDNQLPPIAEPDPLPLWEEEEDDDYPRYDYPRSYYQ